MVPIYGINSFLDNVPLIGDILTGKSEGILGMPYQVSGSTNELELTVNPLGILAPGFLREIFSIGDRPAARDDRKRGREKERGPN
jgi:hypothetical protein